MSITIKDIASLAGVSRGTVDRALNDRGQIAADVKARVLKIAKDHGYVKNIIASNLAKRKKTLVSIVLPDPKMDEFWSAPRKGIHDILPTFKPYGLELKFENFKQLDSVSYCNAFDRAIQEKPDAILVAPIFLKESLLYFKIAEQNNIPVVCINSEIQNSNILSYIGQDSFQCGFLAGKLFNINSSREKNTIAVLTLGRHTTNAVHISKKISGLKHYNNLNKCAFDILDFVCEDFENKSEIKKLTEGLLEFKSSLRGIFFTNSRAYKFLNHNKLFKTNFTDSQIIGFDLLEENIQLLESGDIDFLLNQNPSKQGYLGVVSIFDHLVHKKSIPHQRYLPIDVVMKENYQQYVQSDNFS